MSVPSENRNWVDRYDPDLEIPPVATASTGLDLFEASCRRAPDGPAIHYIGSTATWTEIDRSARRFAGWLVDRGLGRGDRVAIWLQNVPEFVIALVGTWRAGCVVVPLNPMLRRNEVSHQLADSGARVLVGEAALVEGVTPAALREGSAVEAIVTVGEGSPAGDSGDVTFDTARSDHDDPTFDARRPAPGDIAFLVYTSGTTGRPKGAMNTHANVAHNAEVFRAWMHLGPGDVILGGAPLFHITGLMAGIVASHASGCPLVLFYRFGAATCLELIERWKATFTVLPSTAVRALLDSPDLESRDISTLTKFYSGGAPIPITLAREWQAATGHRLYSIYGLTETTSPSHAAPLGQPVRVDEGSGMLAVGVPVPGVDSKVVDEAGDELPAGTLGEIWTKGPMVVPGYWNRPDATEASIVGGYLRTGDVGQRDEQGWFYVVDRIKDMINASGFKVWPREVEDALLAHPAIAEAAVVGVPDSYRGETVKAFVRLRAGHEATAEQIISWARAEMAAYKYPRLVEIVGELPKTASGKVLRRALRTGS